MTVLERACRQAPLAVRPLQGLGQKGHRSAELCVKPVKQLIRFPSARPRPSSKGGSRARVCAVASETYKETRHMSKNDEVKRLTITQPDDWHLHLRDGAGLNAVVGHSAAQFARAIIMPNLKPPVTTVAMAEAYRARILAELPPGSAFEPLMTLYLTDNTTREEVQKAKESGFVKAFKLYPAGATTNSDAGVSSLDKCMGALEEMEKQELPLLVHGEVTDPSVDVFDREAVFLERVLAPLLGRLAGLRCVVEHATTAEAVQFVQSQDPQLVAATVTPQHLLLSRNALFQGGLRPHHYCLPVLKREKHRQALLAAVSSGSRQFFLGTDSAPHERGTKEAPCGCAGVYSAHAALQFYAQAFEEAGALDKLEGFASFNGPDFYHLPRNEKKVTLVKSNWLVPKSYPFGEGGTVIPLSAGETLSWSFERSRT